MDFTHNPRKCRHFAGNKLEQFRCWQWKETCKKSPGAPRTMWGSLPQKHTHTIESYPKWPIEWIHELVCNTTTGSCIKTCLWLIIMLWLVRLSHSLIYAAKFCRAETTIEETWINPRFWRHLTSHENYRWSMVQDWHGTNHWNIDLMFSNQAFPLPVLPPLNPHQLERLGEMFIISEWLQNVKRPKEMLHRLAIRGFVHHSLYKIISLRRPMMLKTHNYIWDTYCEGYCMGLYINWDMGHHIVR